MTSANANGNWKSSDLYIHNGSYLRLKNAQIGYTLPVKWTRVASIQRLRVYVGAENLFLQVVIQRSVSIRASTRRHVQSPLVLTLHSNHNQNIYDNEKS